jgi:DNA-binding XRE family transcriptional regulator
MNNNQTIYGALPYHACTGEPSIKTKGAYKEGASVLVDTSRLRAEVAGTARFGGGLVYSKPTYKLDVKLIHKLRKKLGITQTGIYKKMKLSTTTFYNAINGGRVQKHCVERFAELLGVSEEELIIKEDEK